VGHPTDGLRPSRLKDPKRVTFERKDSGFDIPTKSKIVATRRKPTIPIDMSRFSGTAFEKT
jgi:hypothetical protein